MLTQSHKQLYYQDNSIKLEIEVLKNLAILHCECTEWKPSTYKRLLSVFHTLIEESKGIGIKEFMTVTPNPKFAHLFGGVTTTKIVYLGKEYEVVKWDLK